LIAIVRFQELMDHLAVPRANGSEGLRETAAFIHTTLQTHTFEIELQTFSATPYGTQLLTASIFGGTALALFAVMLVFPATFVFWKLPQVTHSDE